MSKTKRSHKINNEIFYDKVRVSGVDIEPRVLYKKEALELAYGMGKDLILISENANPPFCKIEDYNKFVYDLEKKKKEQEKKAPKNDMKEITLGVFIAENDLKTKARKAEEFLKEGTKVKCTLMLKSREKAKPEQGELVMLNFINMLQEVGSPESMPKMDGNKWICIIKQKK